MSSTATTNTMSVLAQSYGTYGGRGSMAPWNLANLYTAQSGRSQSLKSTQAENQRRRSAPEPSAESSSSSSAYRALCASLEAVAASHPIVQDAVSAFSKIVGLLPPEMAKGDKKMKMMDGIMMQMRCVMAGLLLVLERTPIPSADFLARSEIRGLMADVTGAVERAYEACVEYGRCDSLKRIVTAPYWTDVFGAIEEDLRHYESRINAELGAVHQEEKDVVRHRYQEEEEGKLEKVVFDGKRNT